MKKIGFFTLLLTLSACGSKAPQHRVEPLRVGTYMVEASAEQLTKVYVGIVEEERSVAMSFPLGGSLAEVAVDEGQFVKKGQLIAELDATSAQQVYDSSKAQLEQAQDAYARLKQLYDAESLPEIKWVDIQTQLRKAEAAFQIAEKNLADCTITAPFSGVVGKRMAEAGETVLPGAPVVTLLEIERVKVAFPVPEQEISKVNPQSRIEIVVSALDNRCYTGADPEKSIKANPMAHTYKVRAKVANADHQLLPGMVCRVEMEAAADALAEGEFVLPMTAVRESGDGARFVWIVEGDTVARRGVKVGRLVENGVIISDGLRAGDRVVTEGVQKIGDGTKVIW